MCIGDPEKIEFQQGESENNRKSLVIIASICSDLPHCHSEEDIQAALFSNTITISFIKNKSLFQPDEYGDLMVATFTHIDSVFNVARRIMFNSLVQHQVSSEESWLGLGLYAPKEKVWFENKINQRSVEIVGKEYDDLFLVVETSVSKDVEIHKRSIYTILDLLGDVGGLLDAIAAILQILLSVYFVLRGNPIEQFLMGLVFKRDL